ncbi:hypothetical protein BB559_004500 [Furculomyces boomerangus]|uniref:Cytoplasmic tRNA adenylyltransferase 1 n=1 Tax=Furculomyces boomerangus TaxID=61424 RepID=A0A2T9YE91_9FUNG|nr:hypothetical protein BB559_004500 [Furculomyces boomerangus]
MNFKGKGQDIGSFMLAPASFANQSTAFDESFKIRNFKDFQDGVREKRVKIQGDFISSEIYSAGDGKLSEGVFEKLMRLEAGSRSSDAGVQIEAISGFTELLVKHPFPVVANSAFLKLADIFALGSNLARYQVTKVFKSTNKQLLLVYNNDELVKRVLVVLDSNDPIARSLTLLLLGNAAIVFHSNKRVLHAILQHYQSDSLELATAVHVTENFLTYNPSFLEIAWESLISICENPLIPIEIRKKVISCTKHSKNHPVMRQWVVNWCKKQIKQVNEANTHNYGSKVEGYTDFTIDTDKNNTTQSLEEHSSIIEMHENEMLIPALKAWSSVLESRSEWLSTNDIKNFTNLIRNSLEYCQQQVLLVLLRGIPETFSQTDLNMKQGSEPEENSTKVYKHLILCLNKYILELKNMNNSSHRKLAKMALEIISKCFKSDESRLVCDLVSTWLSSDLNKICMILNLQTNEFLDTENLNFSIYKNTESESMTHTNETKTKNVNLCIQKYIWKTQIVLQSVVPVLLSEGNQYEQEIQKLILNGYNLLLFLKPYNTNKQNCFDEWIPKFMKRSFCTVIDMQKEDYLFDLGKVTTKLLGASESKVQIGASICLKKIMLANPQRYKNEILPIIVNVLNNEIIDNKWWGNLLSQLVIQTEKLLVDSNTVDLEQEKTENSEEIIRNAFEKLCKYTNETKMNIFEMMEPNLIWNILKESVSGGQWEFVQFISHCMKNNNRQTSSGLWWSAIYDLSRAELERHLGSEQSHHLFQSAISKLELISNEYPSRIFQPKLVRFHYECCNLVEKVVAFSKISKTQKTIINDSFINRTFAEHSLARKQLDGSISKLIERCEYLKSFHIAIDKTTLGWLNKWSTILFSILFCDLYDKNTKKDESNFSAPKLFLGSLFIKSPPNLSIEIDTHSEIPRINDTMTSESVSSEINQQLLQYEKYELGSRLGLSDGVQGSKVPAGTQFSIRLQGLVSLASYGYGNNSNLESRYGKKSKGISNVNDIDKVENFLVGYTSTSSEFGASELFGQASEKDLFIDESNGLANPSASGFVSSLKSFRAQVWLSNSQNKIVPEYTICSELKDIIKRRNELMNQENEGKDELFDFLNDYSNNELGNIHTRQISECVPWSSAIEKPVSFEAIVKNGYFDCTVTQKIPISSSFNTVYRNHRGISGSSEFEDRPTVSLGRLNTNIRIAIGDKVAIGASGGKDSTVLAYVLKLLNEKYDYGINLYLLSIDEGISGYRDDSLQTVKRNKMQYDMDLKILSYKDCYGWSMDEIVSAVGQKNNCTFCGVFRRQALDRGALILGADHIVTGHNADDIAETILMNILRGDIGRLARCTEIMSGSDDLVKRSKPFKYTYEKEIVMYAYHKKLDYFATECTYSPNAYRGYARVFLKDLEAVRPSSILDIIYSGEQFLVKNAVKMPTQSVCQECGYMSSNPLCKACVLLEGLNKGKSKIALQKNIDFEGIKTNEIDFDLNINDENSNKQTSGNYNEFVAHFDVLRAAIAENRKQQK